MIIRPWQVPLVIMAVLIGVETFVASVPRVWTRLTPIPRWVKVAALLLLTTLSGAGAIKAWGTADAGNVVTVFTGIATLLFVIAFLPGGDRSGRDKPEAPPEAESGPPRSH